MRSLKAKEILALIFSISLLSTALSATAYSADGNQQNGSNNFPLGPLGSKCTKNGLIAFNGQMTAICKKGKVSYVLASDVPKTPVGGYKTRPSWYPKLSEVFSNGRGPANITCKPLSIKFTSPVIPLDKLAPTIPYGMTIGDHVTPIDHGYIGVKTLSLPTAERNSAAYVPITSPADGTIIEVGSLGSTSSHRVLIDHGCNLISVYMVINKLTGVLAPYAKEVDEKGYVSLRLKIKAGQEFGRQRDNPLDFNVFDGTSWLSGFQNPQAYLYAENWKPYTADYLPFFTPQIRNAMEAQLQRTTSPRVGKIDYDIAGSASGNWFLQGTNGYTGRPNSDYATATSMVQGPPAGKNQYSWSHLSIAPHQVDSSKWIFSSGWWQDPRGDADQALIVVGSGQVAPDRLTASSGMVVYKLEQVSIQDPANAPAREPGSMAPFAVGYTLIPGGSNKGIVALQVNSQGTLSVELNTTMKSPSEFTSFTSAKRTYAR